jgi:hypothetical protein
MCEIAGCNLWLQVEAVDYDGNCVECREEQKICKVRTEDQADLVEAALLSLGRMARELQA